MNPQLQLLLQQAIQAFQGGNLDRADSILKKVVQMDAKNLPALHVSALIKVSQAKYMEAAELLGRAARIHPNDASIQYNLAKALVDCGSYKESIPHHKRAIELAPNNREAWLSYGNAVSNLKGYGEALSLYDSALNLSPNWAEALSKKGVALKELKCYDEAIICCDRALALNPILADTWGNKGNILYELKHYDEAIANYDEALSLAPDYAEGWSYRGMALHELKRYDEAIVSYDKALRLSGDIKWAYGELLHIRMKICNWSNLKECTEYIVDKVVAKKKVTNPFPLLALSDDPLLNKQSSEIYANDKFPFNFSLGPIPRRPSIKKIKVGYFSADFHNHATGYLIAELFELHDKSQFEIIAFSFGPIQNDAIRQRLVKSFDQFIEVGGKSDIEIAQLSRALNIDIAIDLKGFTQDSRTGIFTYRAAPIQVNYLGYPGTMGADYIDYIIADKILITSQEQKNYSEKVVYLPNSYQVNDRNRLASDKKFTKQELGLPESGFVFCCFNNNYKILPAIFDGWMRILKGVEGSVLWLLKDNPWVVENLEKEAEKQGIDAKRLVFADRISFPEHLARHHQADLFLDTFPCNAHTTTSDALWTGLPILTLMGDSFPSRVAASLLNAVHLPELITTTHEDYVQLAIELAGDAQKLSKLKQRLKENLLNTPLFNTPLFVSHLENAYIQMHQRYQSNLPFDHIYIQD